MTILLANIVGGTIAGFTTPGYTVAADNPPDATTGKQWSISAITGTQASVRAHSISDPFTVTFERPRNLQTLLNLVSAVTGIYSRVPSNVYTGCRVRKGVNIAASNTPRIAIIEMKCSVPAGSDSFDSPNVKAMVSAFVGAVNAQCDNIATMLVSGSL